MALDPLERPLGVAELVQWRNSEAAAFHAVLVADVEGELGDDDLRRGLRALQARHPLLRVRVEPTADGAWFRGGVGPIPLVTGAGPTTWVALAEEELNGPLDTANGPLARVRIVRDGPRRQRVAITLAHMIADGTAAVRALVDLLRAADGETLAPLGSPPPIDARLPSNARGVRGALNAGRLLLGLARHRGCTRPRADAEVPPHERRTRLVPRRLGPLETARLVERARREGTTVHGALCAAMCLEVARDASGEAPIDLRLRSPINLRADLVPPAPDDVGMFASTMFYDASIRSRDDLWALARAIRERFLTSARTGLAASSTFLMPALFRRAGGTTGTHRDFAARWRAATPSTCGLTNLGPVAVGPELGRLRIASIDPSLSLSAFGDLSCIAHTWQGELRVTLVCPEPTFAPAHGDALADAVLARVAAAL